MIAAVLVGIGYGIFRQNGEVLRSQRIDFSRGKIYLAAGDFEKSPASNPGPRGVM
jgi:hypothetical protein